MLKESRLFLLSNLDFPSPSTFHVNWVLSDAGGVLNYIIEPPARAAGPKIYSNKDFYLLRPSLGKETGNYLLVVELRVIQGGSTCMRCILTF